MPRHMLPQVGTTVWFFADPTRRPQAAIVTKRTSYSQFNLGTFNAQTGAYLGIINVPFLENPALRAASGQFCTPTGIQDDIDGSSGCYIADAESLIDSGDGWRHRLQCWRYSHASCQHWSGCSSGHDGCWWDHLCCEHRQCGQCDEARTSACAVMHWRCW